VTVTSREPDRVVRAYTPLPDGTDRQKIAEASGNATLGSLVWSGDGRLACALGRAGAVVIVSAAARQRVQLPFTEIAAPDWSPDGTEFVVVGLRKGASVYDVYTVRMDGTRLRRLTKNLEAYAASWR
jgi:hypothetical protein